jgi:cytoplasmic iron level regulating protein YaaA (DUF328/UPF0246 family)
VTSKVILVSCVKSKRTVPSEAQDLYTSDLFISMRAYAEKNSDEWFILSAEHGILHPSEVIAPYEKTLNRMPKVERLEWAEKAQRRISELIPSDASIVILAGERYREHIVTFLRERGNLVEIPMAGLKFGFQLRWLKARINNEPTY